MKNLPECVQKFVELVDKYKEFDIFIELETKDEELYGISIENILRDKESESSIELSTSKTPISNGYGEGLFIKFNYGAKDLKESIYFSSTIRYSPSYELLHMEEVVNINHGKFFDKEEYNIDKKAVIKIIKIFTKLAFLSIEKIFKNKQKIYAYYKIRYDDFNKTHYMVIHIRDDLSFNHDYYILHSTTLFDVYRFLATKKYNDEIINAAYKVITALIKYLSEKLEKKEKEFSEL